MEGHWAYQRLNQLKEFSGNTGLKYYQLVGGRVGPERRVDAAGAFL
jgi:hypothetical protein